MNPSIDQPDDAALPDDAAISGGATRAGTVLLDSDDVEPATSTGEEAGDQTEDAGDEERPSRADLLEREGEVAADYLEGLLDIVDADGDIDMDVEGQRAVVSIIGERLRHLVGPKGVVLDALQELTRLAVARETGVRSRLMLDVAGHRAQLRLELTEVGSNAAQRVIAEGVPVKLAPMSAFERKVVHDAIAAAGLRSESEGVDPQRFVVVLPSGWPRNAGETAAVDDDAASADADVANAGHEEI